MNSIHRRNSSLSVHSGRGIAYLRTDGDQPESNTLGESRIAPAQNDYDDDSSESRSEYDVDEYYHRPRRADNYYGIRQEYLRSYTFTRDEPPPEKMKMKDTLTRFKAVVWAVLCCKYKSSQPKALREKLASRSSRFLHESTDYLSASCRKITVPSCIRLSTLEVA